jgi:hypothetical protein
VRVSTVAQTLDCQAWTTLPEKWLVAGITEALTAHVRTANELKRTLVEGAEMIAVAAGHSVTPTVI